MREREGGAPPWRARATAQGVFLTPTVTFFLDYVDRPLISPEDDYKNRSQVPSSATSLDATLPSN